MSDEQSKSVNVGRYNALYGEYEESEVGMFVEYDDYAAAKAALAEAQSENDEHWTERMRMAANSDRYRKERNAAQSALCLTKDALAAMTEDRNLWQEAHDEDCPNKAALDEVQRESADRLKTIGRLAQELFDARKERDALRRALGVTE
jgi:hypothetical protein